MDVVLNISLSLSLSLSLFDIIYITGPTNLSVCKTFYSKSNGRVKTSSNLTFKVGELDFSNLNFSRKDNLAEKYLKPFEKNNLELELFS